MTLWELMRIHALKDEILELLGRKPSDSSEETLEQAKKIATALIICKEGLSESKTITRSSILNLLYMPEGKELIQEMINFYATESEPPLAETEEQAKKK